MSGAHISAHRINGTRTLSTPIAGLPDRQREAIVLRYYAGLSQGEIAAAMGISRGAVNRHTAHGLSCAGRGIWRTAVRAI
jgi:RNA polymerase sigma factor (sigma-70 family)